MESCSYFIVSSLICFYLFDVDLPVMDMPLSSGIRIWVKMKTLHWLRLWVFIIKCIRKTEHVYWLSSKRLNKGKLKVSRVKCVY